uniref:non-specific serine/threonine protein kinase n=1 Tax=Chromera velia CCMP2878 TaxID=1169474 RepID=A0A0G4HZ07_9ALVE|eukprot:Cvel_1548.t1-p1 / transcript=Cvel_1548.t1 / gene=Cvel_1548 / organism=Chromera_velia_CCMP2878 / gene_product=Calcium-dependent protein kinase 2, putative / transcript_product=Calcium-dependent protein kinase 2, putative / location=Cvel_scaffold55:1068-5696(-) / protein_length=724 / sequence_SO=supercontig / SO=protein_coding / is_pseudo=false
MTSHGHPGGTLSPPLSGGPGQGLSTSTTPTAASGDSGLSPLRPVDPEAVKEKLNKVLADRESFEKSAKASFKQYDKDGKKALNFVAVKELIARLCENLHLPPVDDGTLYKIFCKYDFSSDGSLQFEEFRRLYYQLLCRIREKYYPTKSVTVSRQGFVRRTSLSRRQIDITSILRFTKKLGQGSFGEVHLVTEISTGLQRVCKIINRARSQVPMEQIEEEIRVMKELDHPHIIRIFETYDDYKNMYILMDFCEGGELLKRMASDATKGRAWTEEDVALVMQQLLSALFYMHSKRVVHKDLKPENILFADSASSSQGQIKLIDFGLAEMFKGSPQNGLGGSGEEGEGWDEEDMSHNAAGTALYMAPEVFERNFNHKCDIWSAGVVFYLLMTGSLPFRGKTIEEVRKAASCSPVPLDTPQAAIFSKRTAARSLLLSMLEKDFKKRPSARECLDHAFFQQARQATAGTSEALPPAIMSSIQSYMRQSNLKNALVNLMAHQLDMNVGQMREISKIFTSLDTDKSGTLSRDELSEGLARAGLQPWDIVRIVQAMDVDDNKSISYTEFVAACWTWEERELNVLWSAFCKMDLDGDGAVSVDEFIQALTGMERSDQRLLRGRSEEVRKMVKEIDKNGNGRIEWDEFVDFLRRDTATAPAHPQQPSQAPGQHQTMTATRHGHATVSPTPYAHPHHATAPAPGHQQPALQPQVVFPNQQAVRPSSRGMPIPPRG